MRARTTITALAVGLTLITGGTATATTGAAGSGVSGAVQYQPEDSGSVPLAPPETPPVTETTPPPTTTTTEASVTPPATTPTEPKQPAQTPKQHTRETTSSTPTATTPTAAATTPVVQSSGDSLPFTGYDVVPVALLGLALLALGAGIVHRSRRSKG